MTDRFRRVAPALLIALGITIIFATGFGTGMPELGVAIALIAAGVLLIIRRRKYSPNQR